MEINMFIEPIFSKKKRHDFFSFIKLKKLIRKLKKTSPSFDMMIEMFNFLKLLEQIYMYGNDEDHYLFLATVPSGYDAAMIYKERNFSISYLLRKSDKHIAIKIQRASRSKKEDQIIEFNEGDSNIIKTIYDEQKFIFIISCLMNGLSELIQYYYDNKKL